MLFFFNQTGPEKAGQERERRMTLYGAMQFIAMVAAAYVSFQVIIYVRMALYKIGHPAIARGLTGFLLFATALAAYFTKISPAFLLGLIFFSYVLFERTNDELEMSEKVKGILQEENDKLIKREDEFLPDAPTQPVLLTKRKTIDEDDIGINVPIIFGDCFKQ